MKIEMSNKPSSSFGGLIPLLYHIDKCGIPAVIRKNLGTRVNQATYSYKDVIIGWVFVALCGGKKIHDIEKLYKNLSVIPNLSVPSHDTLGRVMKMLATETITSISTPKDKFQEPTATDYNDNIPMLRMLIQATKRTGIFKEGLTHTMDMDATFINTLVRGAKRMVDENGKISHAKIGFNPLVFLIGNLPVYIRMQNGSASPKFGISEALTNCLDLLDESKIKVGRIISDGAGYTKKFMKTIDDRNRIFVIRFIKTVGGFTRALKTVEDWKPTTIETATNFWKCEIADLPYKMYDSKREPVSKTWRVVAIRIPKLDTLKNLDYQEWERQTLTRDKMTKLKVKKITKPDYKPYQDVHWKDIGDYLYKFYVTNDYKAKSEDIVMEYNNRGTSERNFSFMKQDFGWRFPPFSELNQNAVFLIIASLANNIFRGMANKFKGQVPTINLKNRVRKFFTDFIEASFVIEEGICIFNQSNIDYGQLIV